MEKKKARKTDGKTDAKADGRTIEKRAAKPKKLPKQVAQAIAAAGDKQAVNLVVLDLRKSGGFTDFFVIASGTNTRQVRAIADAVAERLEADGAKPAYLEGYDRSEWILLDYFDFIVHVFAPETRAFYDLERLWGNAERIEVSAAP
jgi:ribosome-associated protein